MKIIILLAVSMSLGGCALLAAGVIGGAVVSDCDTYQDCYLLKKGYHHK